ncbi:glutamate carboxypeptidase [Embleya hyalina]|uniref:Glutamate carboxypeptidase n=1 Tax=Embleya hyalina TaxID=516124 RepID=A0A401YCR8_9ACTN|nr:glutamate carboxypeptidase [Embleya hyalina]
MTDSGGGIRHQHRARRGDAVRGRTRLDPRRTRPRGTAHARAGPDAVRSGGGSDGNFTGALGIPTLDGMGAVGGHPHARDEFVDPTRLPGRTALPAAVLDRLCAHRSSPTGIRGHGPGPVVVSDTSPTRTPRRPRAD